MTRELPVYARQTACGLELRVKVVPGASRSQVAGVLGDRLKLRIAAPPEGGKANAAVLALLTEATGCRRIDLVAGHGSPEKILLLRGADASALARLG